MNDRTVFSLIGILAVLIAILVLGTFVEEYRVAQNPDLDRLTELRRQAEQGHADAQFSLGHMYFEGRGVSQNDVQAHKWINLAASRTTEKAEDFRSARDELAKIMTAAQIAEAQRLAREWQPKTWEQLKDQQENLP